MKVKLREKVNMNKILVFIFHGMTDYESTFVTHLLNTSGNKEIVTVAYEKKLVKGRSGFDILPSMVVSEVKMEEFEGLIVPGGWNGDLRPELTNLIKALNKQGKLLAGICGAGTVFLAKAGVLENVQYTTPVSSWTERHKEVFGMEDPFPRKNLIFKRMVRDKNIITAQGTAFVDFAIEICDWFNLFENPEEKASFHKEIVGVPL